MSMDPRAPSAGLFPRGRPGVGLTRLLWPAGAAGLAILLAAGLLLCQPRSSQHAHAPHAPATARFAVVSIKPVRPGTPFAPDANGPVIPGGKYVDHQTSLARLIIFAFPEYASPGKTLVGLPEWAYGSSLFDFDAEPGQGTAPSVAEMRRMMASALADRFHLRHHVKHEEMPVLVLAVAQGGTRFLKCSATVQPSMQVHFGFDRITGRGVPADELAAVVGIFFQGTPVVNHTHVSAFATWMLRRRAERGQHVWPAAPAASRRRPIEGKEMPLTLGSGAAVIMAAGRRRRSIAPA